MKRALIKDGWTIEAEQYRLTVPYRRLWIDIQATKRDSLLAIVVEVKGFESQGSLVDAFSDALGQYILYRTLLEIKEADLPLYLAVPEAAYESILSEPFAQETIRRNGVKMILFSPEREEITQWIP